MQLYTRATSSCAFRVRIGLNLLQLRYESIPIKAVDQEAPDFAALNPQKLVPLLVNGDDRIGQSIAILEYLDETFGSEQHALLPNDPAGRARVRAISQFIVSEIQPLQNTRLDPELKRLNVDDGAWKTCWIKHAFPFLNDALSSAETGAFCHGNSASIADCCLIPQVWNAINRYNVDLAEYPAIGKVYVHCASLPAFADAMPEKQADFSPV